MDRSHARLLRLLALAVRRSNHSAGYHPHQHFIWNSFQPTGWVFNGGFRNGLIRSGETWKRHFMQKIAKTLQIIKNDSWLLWYKLLQMTTDHCSTCNFILWSALRISKVSPAPLCVESEWILFTNMQRLETGHFLGQFGRILPPY
jgi:hypothetical protein